MNFDISKWAMILLGIIILAVIIVWLIITVRCTIWFVPECLQKEWGRAFQEWLLEIIPILVAIIMVRRNGGE